MFVLLWGIPASFEPLLVSLGYQFLLHTCHHSAVKPRMLWAGVPHPCSKQEEGRRARVCERSIGFPKNPPHSSACISLPRTCIPSSKGVLSSENNIEASNSVQVFTFFFFLSWNNVKLRDKLQAWYKNLFPELLRVSRWLMPQNPWKI